MSSNNDANNLPYVLQSNGCRYYVEDAENDTRAGIQHDIVCAACLKHILFVNGYHKPSAGVHIAPHFKHYPRDLEACTGYEQLQTSAYCLDSLKKNAKNSNLRFELECESFNCIKIVPSPYVIAFREANVAYRTAFINASNNAIKDKTFRIKANKDCPFFNNTRCKLCENAKCARDLADQETADQIELAKKKREAVVQIAPAEKKREAVSQIPLASRFVKDEEEREAAAIRRAIRGRDWSHTYWMQFLPTKI